MNDSAKINSRNGTKKQIADALETLISEKKFSKITVGDICEKASLSRQSFYRHFSDKYDVFSYLFKTYIDDTLEDYGLMAMPEITKVGLEFFRNHKYAIKDMGCDFGCPNPFMNYWFHFCFEHYYNVIGKARITPDLEAAMKFYFHATYFTFYEYVSGNISADPAATIRIILNFMPEIIRNTLYKTE